jgi:hypothetical protein
MTTSLNHGSATIYQFPAGGRSALGGRRYEETVTVTVTDLASTAVSAAASSSGWYHEAAIQESNPLRER